MRFEDSAKALIRDLGTKCKIYNTETKLSHDGVEEEYVKNSVVTYIALYEDRSERLFERFDQMERDVAQAIIPYDVDISNQDKIYVGSSWFEIKDIRDYSYRTDGFNRVTLQKINWSKSNFAGDYNE